MEYTTSVTSNVGIPNWIQYSPIDVTTGGIIVPTTTTTPGEPFTITTYPAIDDGILNKRVNDLENSMLNLLTDINGLTKLITELTQMITSLQTRIAEEDIKYTTNIETEEKLLYEW